MTGKNEEQLKHWCAENPSSQRDILYFFLLYHIYDVISHRYTHSSFEPTNFNLTFNIPHATHERMKKIKLLANCLMYISPDEPLDRHLFATFTNNIRMLYFLKEKTDNVSLWLTWQIILVPSSCLCGVLFFLNAIDNALEILTKLNITQTTHYHERTTSPHLGNSSNHQKNTLIFFHYKSL